jgi:hypothetical protein
MQPQKSTVILNTLSDWRKKEEDRGMEGWRKRKWMYFMCYAKSKSG